MPQKKHFSFSLHLNDASGIPEKPISNKITGSSMADLFVEITKRFKNNPLILNQCPVVQNLHKINFLHWVLDQFPPADEFLKTYIEKELQDAFSLKRSGYRNQFRIQKIMTCLAKTEVRNYFYHIVLPNIVKLCCSLDEKAIFSFNQEQLLFALQQEHETYLNECTRPIECLEKGDDNYYDRKDFNLSPVIQNAAEKRRISVENVIQTQAQSSFPTFVIKERIKENLENPNMLWNLAALVKIAENETSPTKCILVLS